MMKNFLFICMLLLGLSTSALAQESIVVTGVVTDTNKEPMIGVNVSISNIPGLGAITDLNGKYSIKMPPYHKLVFTYIGFEKVEVLVKEQRTVNVTMKEASAREIDEVVITGTGAQKKLTVTGAITNVDVDVLKANPSGSMANALAGNVPGILAMQTSGKPGSVSEFWIDLIAYDGTLLKARNIIGSYKPESKKRIALFAHWDTRPWADNDADEKNHHTPILGANDGASGVGALLEIARLVNQQQPELGIDIIFLDAEDYGTPQFYEGKHKEEAWCLGSQYWSRNPHVQGYNARFGILLDMVGGENSVFLKEGYSEEFAPDINKKVWKAAKKAGYGKTFIDERGDTITDDHLFINRLARIKTIDIIPNDLFFLCFRCR